VRARGGPQLKTVSLANIKEIFVGSCIRIKWLTGDARGYTDEFPVAGFAQQVATAERVHLVHGPRGGQHHARCRIRIQGSRSKIDYRPFRPYNTRHGMVPYRASGVRRHLLEYLLARLRR